MKNVFLSLCLAFSLNGLADTSKVINFENQREENFELENWLKETLYKTEQVKGTCYKDVDSVERVCRDVTRYRQECSTVPGHNECHTTYDNQCHYETTYENVCHTGPDEQDCRVVVRYRQECTDGGRGERVCRTIPGDVVCHRAPNGENRCEKIPPRQECSDGPSRPQVCRQVPYEERECRRIPGRYECHQEPRQNQVCRQVPREVCDWIPAENVCRNIPYNEEVCGMENVTKKVPYECMKTVQVPYEKITKTHKADVNVEFTAPSFSPKMQFESALSVRGELTFKVLNFGSDKHFALLEKAITNDDRGELNNISANYKVNFISIENELTATKNGIKNIEANKRSLDFTVDGKFDAKRTVLSLEIIRKDETKFKGDFKVGQYTVSFDGKESHVHVDLEALGAPKLGGLGTKSYTMKLKLTVDYSNLGNVITTNEKVFTISGTEVVKVD